MYDCIIIGGGAAGLMAACVLAQAKISVCLIEKQPRVGRKLLSTGNGRCNLTNIHADKAAYHGSAFAEKVINACPPEKVRDLFDRLGVPTVADEEGRVYPMSNAAASVLDALRLYCDENGVTTKTDAAVASIKKGFTVICANGETLKGKNVLVCTGGLAAPKLGGCSDGYALLESMGHICSPKYPAISPLKVPAELVRPLKGQRAQATVTLCRDGKPVRTESGEILFNDGTLSGICVMQLARDCSRKGKYSVQIKFSSDTTETLRERAKRLPKRLGEDFLNGIVSKRIGMTLMKQANIDLHASAEQFTHPQLTELARVLNGWTLPVEGVCGFDSAQVTAGGILTRDFDPNTMMSRLVNGLYAAGEVLDVDGDCGGFNLQFAFGSAIIAAESIISEE